jgi:hypothetical protein
MIHTKIPQKVHNNFGQTTQLAAQAAHRRSWPSMAIAPAEITARKKNYGALTDATPSTDGRARSHPKHHRAENSRPLTGGRWHAGTRAALTGKHWRRRNE